MAPTPRLIDVDRAGSTLILNVSGDAGSLADDAVQNELKHALNLLQDPTLLNIVVDLKEAAYFGSTLLGALIKLWRIVCIRGGRLVLCSISPHELEVVQVMRLDTMWPVYANRAEALEALGC